MWLKFEKIMLFPRWDVLKTWYCLKNYYESQVLTTKCLLVYIYLHMKLPYFPTFAKFSNKTLYTSFVVLFFSKLNTIFLLRQYFFWVVNSKYSWHLWKTSSSQYFFLSVFLFPTFLSSFNLENIWSVRIKTKKGWNNEKFCLFCIKMGFFFVSFLLNIWRIKTD